MRVRIAARALPIVSAGNTRLANEPAPETGSHPQLDGKNQDQDGAEREVRERQAKQADDREQAVVPAIAAAGGAGLPPGGREGSRTTSEASVSRSV